MKNYCILSSSVNTWGQYQSIYNSDVSLDKALKNRSWEGKALELHLRMSFCHDIIDLSKYCLALSHTIQTFNIPGIEGV